VVFAVFSVVGANKAQAQVTSNDVLNAAAGLVNVQIGNVIVNDVEVITLDGVVITDVIDITNVLNNNDIRVLSGILVNIEIDNVLNDLLRNAEFLNNNQVVVGVLSGGIVLVTDAANLVTNAKKTKKK
jgi:hypothetical protein